MVLRSKTIRLGIFVSAVIIAAILLFQLIWLKKVYRYEQKEFNHGIVRAVRGFYEDVGQSLDQSFLSQLITLPNEQTFFARIANPNLNRDSLVFYMQSELEDENIFTDCYLGLYDGQHQRYVFTAFLPGAAGAKKQSVILPASGLHQDHLTLFFPHRSQYLLSRMNLWIVSTVILLAVLLGLGALGLQAYDWYEQGQWAGMLALFAAPIALTIGFIGVRRVLRKKPPDVPFWTVARLHERKHLAPVFFAAHEQALNDKLAALRADESTQHDRLAALNAQLAELQAAWLQRLPRSVG